MTPSEQATEFSLTLNKFLRDWQKDHQMDGGLLVVCIVRMGAKISMDSGMSLDEFQEFARSQYEKVPLARKEKGDNVIKFPEPQ